MAASNPVPPTPQGNARKSAEPLSRAVRAFHWATVLLVVAMFALVWTAGALPPGPVPVAMITWHRSIGLCILALTMARLLRRSLHPLPPAELPVWKHRASATVQAGLYACLVAMPLLGWSASAISGDTVRFFGLPLPDVLPFDETLGGRLFAAHGVVAVALLALAGLHVAAALHHRFVLRDGVADRMLGRVRR